MTLVTKEEHLMQITEGNRNHQEAEAIQGLLIEEEKTMKEEIETTIEAVITEGIETVIEIKDTIRGTLLHLKDLRIVLKIESQVIRKIQEASKREKVVTNPEIDSTT